MKTLCLFAFLLTVISFTASAQKTDKTSIDYEMTMYPRNLITKEGSVNVITESNYKSLVEDRRAEVAAIYDQERSKSTGQKVLEGLSGNSNKVNERADAIIIPTLLGEGNEGSIKIPGFTESNTAKGTIKLSFYPLEVTASTGTSFQYSALKVDVTITNDKGEMIHQGSLPAMKTPRTYSMSSTERYKDAFARAEIKARDESIGLVNDFLKREYGYTKVKDDRRFYDVKDKKQQYPEYHTAIEKVKTAFAYLAIDSKKAEKEAALKEAVTIWQEQLKQLDKANKDARINKDIAAATYLNIAEASIWLNDFEKTKEALVEYKLLDEDYSRTEKGITTFLEDYSKRYESYSKY